MHIILKKYANCYVVQDYNIPGFMNVIKISVLYVTGSVVVRVVLQG